jgi:hypothetical protein
MSRNPSNSTASDDLRPSGFLVVASLLTILLAVLLGSLDLSTSAAPAPHTQTRVAAIEQPTGQLVGPSETVLAVQGRERAPNYDRSATGSPVAPQGGAAATTTAADILRDPQALEGLTLSQVDDLARNAGYDILPGNASAANPATRYYVPGTNGWVGFRVLPSGVAGRAGVKGGAYLRFFGGPFAGLRIPLASP